MDIIFKCPHCDQELEVDAAGAGSNLQCPSCANTIVIPSSDGQANGAAAAASRETAPPASPPTAKERHFSVPVHAGPAEALIQKPNKPLDVAAKETDKKLRIRTFKRVDCQEVGKDRFDELVSNFLDKVGQANIVSINPINYGYVQMDSHATVTDYGVLIVYRG